MPCHQHDPSPRSGRDRRLPKGSLPTYMNAWMHTVRRHFPRVTRAPIAPTSSKSLWMYVPRGADHPSTPLQLPWIGLSITGEEMVRHLRIGVDAAG
ncbi:hypothetical protein XA68_17945 [Ophiocordyceps unilateralis]|uniref:Uncharacterized protein n=1 Tax=Ophiocordyceps unilateralis TaxID=268505 RepID=A0A2A9P417_OPHUN|nr:hypothetical protein XA68_17945 [Ophiocordyceps unilateralis]